MKKYHILYATLLTITATFLPVLGMEKENLNLTQSRIGFTEKSTHQSTLFNTVFNKQIEQSYKKQKNAIAKKQKANLKISLDEWKEYQTALNDYNNNIPKNAPIKAEIQAKLENLIKNIQQKEIRTELVAFKARSKEGRNIQDLQKYKENLQIYLAHLKNPTPEKVKEYQDIIDHINLINRIDAELKVNYKNFNMNELLTHIELLQELQKNLQNVFSERYQKLDNRIPDELQYYEQLKEKREQEELEEKKQLEQ